MGGRARLIPREVLFGNPEKTGASLSPEGGRIAYLAPVDGVLNVWVAGLDGSGTRPLTASRDAPVSSYLWAFDSRSLLYLQDADGDENFHLFVVDLEGGDARDLTPFPGAKVNAVHASPRVPGELLVGINARDASWFDLYRIDLATATATLVEQNPGLAGWVVDRGLNVRGGVRTLDDSGWELLLRKAGGEWEAALVVDGDAALNSSIVGFGSDDELYILESTQSDTNRLVRMNLATAATEVLAHDPGYDISGVHLHPLTGELLTVTVTRTRHDFLYIAPSIADDIKALSALGAGHPVIVSTDLTDNAWIVALNSDVATGQYHLFDRRTGEGRVLMEEQPALRDYTMAPMEPFSFPSRDGLVIHGYLTFPVDLPRELLPTILLVHGGPWGRTDWGFHGHAQQLANRGYLVVLVNFRGSTGYGKAFVNAGDREWGGRMHDDLIDAVEFVVAEGFADRARVGICGGSYGGYAALVGVTMTPDVFRCAVAERGPVNLVSLIENVPPYWGPEISLFHRRVGHPEQDRDLLVARSPLTHVGRVRAPVLLTYGAQDPRVTRAEAEQIAHALDEVGADYELIIFEDEGHGLSRPENRLRMFEASERFFAAHLGGRFEDPVTPAAGTLAV